MSPTDKLLAAMPGTLADLAGATGYPVGSVLRLIGELRRSGHGIVAVEDGVTRNVRSKAHSETDVLTTVYRSAKVGDT